MRPEIERRKRTGFLLFFHFIFKKKKNVSLPINIITSWTFHPAVSSPYFISLLLLLLLLKRWWSSHNQQPPQSAQQFPERAYIRRPIRMMNSLKSFPVFPHQLFMNLLLLFFFCIEMIDKDTTGGGGKKYNFLPTNLWEHYMSSFPLA